ncbi:MAG TPA: protein kinase [Pyrinomonadaceae bacterium]|jgi:serine/threonine protein kinase/Flp pilus assembly protein TadD
MKRCENCNLIITDEHAFCPDDGRALADDEVATRLQAALGAKYTLTHLIGKGAMGAVYRARHRDLDDVAIKVMLGPPDNQQLSERFIREARALRKLRHQHAVTIYDVDRSTPGLTYMVMEMIAGGNLREDLRERGRLTLDEVMEIATAVCGALQAAHERGIIHRDIKPDNILMAEETTITGKVLRTIKIADFGIVKLRGNQRGGEASIKLTQFGTPIGTPFYMSPEQWFGEGAGITALDGRTDIYALGCTIYELLSGRTPFIGNTTSELRRQHLEREPTPLYEVAKNVPEPVSRVIMRTLAKDKDERYQSPAEFSSELRRAYDESFGKTVTTTRNQLLSKQMTETIDPSQPPAPSSTPPSTPPRDRQSTMEVLPFAQPPQVYSEQALTQDDDQEPMPIRLAKAVEEARRRIDEEQRRIEEETKRAQEEALRAEEEARRLAEEEARLKAEEEEARRAEEEAARRAEEERLRAEEEARRRLEEEEEKRKAEEEARRREEEERRLAAEAEARRLEEEERKRAEEARRAAEEEAARLQAEEEERKLAEEEAQRLAAEEEARRRAEEEAARKRAEEEARLKSEEERRLAAEAEARRLAEEEARRKAVEEAERLRAEQEAQRRAEVERQRREAEEAEAQRKAAEQARLRGAEEAARRRAEEEERRRAEVQRRAEVEQRRRAEEERQRQEQEQREREEQERIERERREIEEQRAQALVGEQQSAKASKPSDTMVDEEGAPVAAQAEVLPIIVDSPSTIEDFGAAPSLQQAAASEADTQEKVLPVEAPLPPPSTSDDAHHASIMGYTSGGPGFAVDTQPDEVPFDPEVTLVPGINIKTEQKPPEQEEPAPAPQSASELQPGVQPSQEFSPTPEYKPVPDYASWTADAGGQAQAVAASPKGKRQIWFMAALALALLVVVGVASVVGIYLYRRFVGVDTSTAQQTAIDEDVAPVLASMPKGTITVSAPQGSEVFIDDERVGATGGNSQLTTETIAGTRNVRVTKSGSRPWTKDAAVSAGSTLKLSARLQRELKSGGDADHERRSLIEKYTRSGNYYGAEVEYREVLRESPDDVGAHVGLAEALNAQQRYAEALVEYEAAQRLQPNNVQTILSLGQVYEIKRRDADAETTFTRAVQLQPKNASAQALLAWVLLRRGKLEQASSAIEQAIQIKADPEYLDTKAYILLARGQTDEALKLAQSNVEKSKDPAFKAALAVIQYRAGQKDAALNTYRQLRQPSRDKGDDEWGDLKRLMMFRGYSKSVLETLAKLINDTN